MSKIEPRTFRGTRDFLPAEMIQREKLFEYLRSVFQRYGFAPLETPVIEYLDILLGKYGVEGEKLIYPLAYKGGKVLALRYDLTVPLARVVAQHTDLPRPFKRYQMQPVYRADRPTMHQGRYREFYQCDVDIVGEASRVADAEILALMAEVLRGLDLGKFRVRVNHREILRGMVRSVGLPDEAAPGVIRAIDKIDKVGLNGFDAELIQEQIPDEARARLMTLLEQPSGGRAFLESMLTTLGGEPCARTGIEDLLQIWDALGSLAPSLEPFEFRLDLARGLDYYTGAVFEATLDSLPHLGSLCGGGRYDGLVALFSDVEAPAVGVTIGIDRIFTAFDQLGRGEGPPTRTQVLVLQFGPESERPALEMTRRLREAGFNTEVWCRPDRLGRQIQQADRRGIPTVIFQGPDEAARGEWTLKRLSDGEQASLADDAVEAGLRSLLDPPPR